MNEKTDSKGLSLATISILGQPPSHKKARLCVNIIGLFYACTIIKTDHLNNFIRIEHGY